MWQELVREIKESRWGRAEGGKGFVCGMRKGERSGLDG